MNNFERQKYRLEQDIDSRCEHIERLTHTIDQLRDPLKAQEYINSVIAQHMRSIETIKQEVAKKRSKLNKIIDRQNNPPTCPVCKDPMRVGQQTINLDERQFDLEINPKTGRLELHEECRVWAKNFRIGD